MSKIPPIFPIGRQPPPAWIVAPKLFAHAPVQAVLLALPLTLPVLAAPLEAPVEAVTIVKAVASRSSGVEHDLHQLRPWNLPAWK